MVPTKKNTKNFYMIDRAAKAFFYNNGNINPLVDELLNWYLTLEEDRVTWMISSKSEKKTLVDIHWENLEDRLAEKLSTLFLRNMGFRTTSSIRQSIFSRILDYAVREGLVTNERRREEEKYRKSLNCSYTYIHKIAKKKDQEIYTPKQLSILKQLAEDPSLKHKKGPQINRPNWNLITKKFNELFGMHRSTGALKTTYHSTN